MDLHDLTTWPPDVQAALHAAARPPAGNAAIALSRLLANQRVLLHHCTRLLPAELERVRVHGLSPGGPSLVRRKVATAVDIGALRSDQARQVLARHDAGSAERRGRVWFCSSSEHLRDPAPQMLWAFLRHWGGQSAWVGLDEPTRAHLAAMGHPVLIQVAAPLSRVRLSPTAGWQNRTGPRRPNGDDPLGDELGWVPPAERLAFVLWHHWRGRRVEPFVSTVDSRVPSAWLLHVRAPATPELEPGDDPAAWPEVNA